MHSPANADFGCLTIAYKKAYAIERLSSTSSDESGQATWLTPNQQLLVPCEYSVQQEQQQQPHLQTSQRQHQEQQHHSIQQTAAPRRCLAQPLKRLNRRHPVAACLHRQRTMNHNASEESEIAWCEFESLSLLAECEAADEMGTVQTVPAELSQPLAVAEDHRTAAVTSQEGSTHATEELGSVSYQNPISHPPSADVTQSIKPSSDEDSWEMHAQSDEATKAVQQPPYEHKSFGKTAHVKSPKTELGMDEEAAVTSQSSAAQSTQRTSPASPIAQQLVSPPSPGTSVPKAAKRISTGSSAESSQQPTLPVKSLKTHQIYLNSADNSDMTTGEEAAAVSADVHSVSSMGTSDSAINLPVNATMEASVNLPMDASVKCILDQSDESYQDISVKPGVKPGSNGPEVGLSPDKTGRPVERKSHKKSEKRLTKSYGKVFAMAIPDKQLGQDFGEEAAKHATKQPTGPLIKAELRNQLGKQPAKSSHKSAVKSAAGPTAKSPAKMPLKSATKDTKCTPEVEAGAATEKRHHKDAVRAPPGNAVDEATSKSYAKSFTRNAERPMKSGRKGDKSGKTVRAKPASVRSPAAAAAAAQPETPPVASAATAAAVKPPVRKWLAHSALKNQRARPLPGKARAASAQGPGDVKLDKPHQAAARLTTGKRASRWQQPAVAHGETTDDTLTTMTTTLMTPRSQSLCSDLMRPFRESQRVREKRREFGILPDRVKSHQLFMALISADVTRMFGFHAPTVDRIARVCGCRVRLRRAILNRQTNGSGTWAKFAQIEIDGRGPRSALVCDRLLREKFSCYEDRRVMRSDPRASVSQSRETLSSILKLAFIRQWSKSRLSCIRLSGLQLPQRVSGGQVANEGQPAGEDVQLGLVAADQRLELPDEWTG